MADDIAVTAGSGTTIGCDLVAGVYYQRTKLSLGADGSVTDALGAAGAVAAGVQRVVTAGRSYETVAASQTAQALGATGATGDTIVGLVIIPAVVACGAVDLLDNATSISIFVGGGTTALTDAKPFYVPLGMVSASGAWKITTGASVSVIAIGSFT